MKINDKHIEIDDLFASVEYCWWRLGAVPLRFVDWVMLHRCSLSMSTAASISKTEKI